MGRQRPNSPMSDQCLPLGSTDMDHAADHLLWPWPGAHRQPQPQCGQGQFLWPAAHEQVDAWGGSPQSVGLLEPTHPLALPALSFNLKDMAPGLGSETRLDRSKGDTRSDTVLLDSSATLITNEGGPGGPGHLREWG